MRVHICAVGRLRGGPEAELVADYQTRFDRVARPLSLGPLAVHEVDDRKAQGAEAEAEMLGRTFPKAALIVPLDERGDRMGSPDFALKLEIWRDAGHADLAFVIGGADGLAPALRHGSGGALSLGRMVWPHRLVRVMLAEQLYRAASILAGQPYHRA